MVWPFSFEGELRRAPYALASFALFFSQHLAVFAALRRLHQTPVLDVEFWIAPLRALAPAYVAAPLLSVLALAWLLIVMALLAVLSFRRTANAGEGGWIAAFTIAPLIQIPAILYLCAAPLISRPTSRHPPPDAEAESDWLAIAQSVIAAMALTLASVAVGALIFGTYGFGMFVVLPFVVGALSGYLANRRRDLGSGRTMGVALIAAALGSVSLLVAALEGAICIVMAAPLGILIVLLGAWLGRAIARRGVPARTTLSAVALLPLVFVSERLLPMTTRFDTLQRIEIDAPPAAVWRSLVKMDMSDEPIGLPYRLGLAHPLRGEIEGEGVGAIRRGEFSTGTAIERVTEWERDRRLAFVVEKDVPAMRELSFREHVHAPHVIGYFRTTLTLFELVPQTNGGTEVIERTAHEIRLDPILYWMPLASWVVDQNNARVLAHLKRAAEKSRSDGL
jgi:hypothetical protein